jgi:hypothetical protein
MKTFLKEAWFKLMVGASLLMYSTSCLMDSSARAVASTSTPKSNHSSTPSYTNQGEKRYFAVANVMGHYWGCYQQGNGWGMDGKDQ